MNHEQLKYLKEQARGIRRVKLEMAYRKPAIPKPVAVARRMVDAWEKKQHEIASARQVRVEAAHSKAYQAILFGEPDAAMKALKEFEKFQPLRQ